MKLLIGKACDPGLKRKGTNQDSIGIYTGTWLDSRPPLLVIADGMGGYAGGEVASRLVVKAFLDCYKAAHEQDYQSVLIAALVEAHERLKQQILKTPEMDAMGSTVVAAVVTTNHVYLLNVGDSRAYLIRAGELKQISSDHSLVAELARRGIITWAEAQTHPRRNQLTLSVSAKREALEPYVTDLELLPEDRILLCSDGLWSTVPEAQIVSTIINFPLQVAVDRLVKLAYDYHAPDNISIILAQPSE